MIQHIVLWVLKEEVDKEKTFLQLKKVFADFAGDVPGLCSLELHRGFQGYDLCLISTHESKNALRAYQEFPAHDAAKEIFSRVAQQRAACDFETEAP